MVSLTNNLNKNSALLITIKNTHILRKFEESDLCKEQLLNMQVAYKN